MGQNFNYPVLPDTISDRQERVDYMVEHFWNAQNIADTTYFQTPTLLLDYLYLLKQVTDVDKDIHAFVSLSCLQERTFGLILYWLDNILYDSSSPFYNEDLYMRFMNEVLVSRADPVMKLLPQQRVEIMSKNKVGELATDFSFEDKKGNVYSLYEVGASHTLLIFNNPSCSLCHATEETITRNSEIQSLIASGKMRIIAITSDADYEEWLEYKYPFNWIVGYDKESVIYNQVLYDIQRLPCLYLLDKDKRVLVKEADFGRVLNYLSTHSL